MGGKSEPHSPLWRKISCQNCQLWKRKIGRKRLYRYITLIVIMEPGPYLPYNLAMECFPSRTISSNDAGRTCRHLQPGPVPQLIPIAHSARRTPSLIKPLQQKLFLAVRVGIHPLQYLGWVAASTRQVYVEMSKFELNWVYLVLLRSIFCYGVFAMLL